jgi:hypothetical protein
MSGYHKYPDEAAERAHARYRHSAAPSWRPAGVETADYATPAPPVQQLNGALLVAMQAGGRMPVSSLRLLRLSSKSSSSIRRL